jgi:hypothetical protein
MARRGRDYPYAARDDRRAQFGRSRHELHDAFNNVVDVGEVTAHLTVSIDIDRFAGQNCLDELEERHVGTPPWAVDGEEAERRRRYVPEMRIGMRHRLVRLLGRCVDRQRPVGGVRLPERHHGVAAINR